MIMYKALYHLLLLSFLALACEKQQPESKVHLPSKLYRYLDDYQQPALNKLVYVPVYSDIYHMSGAQRYLLTATLSVRNTSRRDTMFVEAVDYYDWKGHLRKQYLRKPIRIDPLESVEFVVEHEEEEGGAGANFLVHWGSNSPSMNPIIQAVMIGTVFQQGISFVTEGVIVEESGGSTSR